MTPPYLLIVQSFYKQGKQSQEAPWSEEQHRPAVSRQICVMGQLRVGNLCGVSGAEIGAEA